MTPVVARGHPDIPGYSRTMCSDTPVSYTHLRAHETEADFTTVSANESGIIVVSLYITVNAIE